MCEFNPPINNNEWMNEWRYMCGAVDFIVLTLIYSSSEEQSACPLWSRFFNNLRLHLPSCPSSFSHCPLDLCTYSLFPAPPSFIHLISILLYCDEVTHEALPELLNNDNTVSDESEDQRRDGSLRKKLKRFIVTVYCLWWWALVYDTISTAICYSKKRRSQRVIFGKTSTQFRWWEALWSDKKKTEPSVTSRIRTSLQAPWAKAKLDDTVTSLRLKELCY